MAESKKLPGKPTGEIRVAKKLIHDPATGNRRVQRINQMEREVDGELKWYDAPLVDLTK